ncbi:hypothetical protein ABT124_03225 [Streptomyces sp. NPDC001982]|uniref:hypothetical protein n=1 Tax=Streptomyces sp. NPDC001982 TaxID=3154405 RepID=UPI003320CB57
MPEPLEREYLTKTQRIIAAVPSGPWEPVTNDYGMPDAVGPISFLETASDEYQVPVIEFVGFAREALPRYVGEVSRLTGLVAELERRLKTLERETDSARHGR